MNQSSTEKYNTLSRSYTERQKQKKLKLIHKSDEIFQ